jgi:hypothetical protein
MKALFLAAQEHNFVEYPKGEKKKKSQSECGKYENFF